MVTFDEIRATKAHKEEYNNHEKGVVFPQKDRNEEGNA